MGDRNVVGIIQPGADTLYLYSHWGGEDQEATLAGALVASMARWDDVAYATRILVSHYVAEEWRNETGYGLSVGWYAQPDYDYIYDVNWTTEMVRKLDLDGAELEQYPFMGFIRQFGKDGA